MKIVCTVIVFIVLGWSKVCSQESNLNMDTTPIDAKETMVNFERTLDSLTNLWYVEKALERFDNTVYPATDTVIPFFTDSQYIARIESLHSMITMTYNPIVRNFIHVYTYRKRDQLEYILGLKDYYFPMFEEVLASYNLPLELKYLPVIESALNPRAVSRAGASGLWQFMYATGRMYNLNVNSYVDERYDPLKASHAAANYLKDMYKVYKDWILVIAAYNCGPGNVNKAIYRSGGKRNYWDIYYHLPKETRGYVPAFIAAMYAVNFYQDHNIHPAEIDMPIVTDTITVHNDLNLNQVAEVLGVPIQQLRDINPMFRHDIIPASATPYAIRVPLHITGQFLEFQDSIFSYKDSIYLKKDDLLRQPTYNTASISKSAPLGDYAKLVYTVKSGDNLGLIAEKYSVRVSDLKYWNAIRGNIIRAGQRLVVYIPASRAAKFKSSSAVKSSGSSSTSGDYIIHVVGNGENLWLIAKKYGVTDTDIKRLNNLTDADKITPGQRLKVKRR